MTTSKRDLIQMSSDTTERFIAEWRSGDIEVGGHPVPFCPCGSAQLFSLYMRWCRDQGEKFPRTSAQFLGSVGKRPGWFRGHKDRYPSLTDPSKSIRTRFVIPSPDDMTLAAKTCAADWRQAPGTTQTVWLSECFFTFQAAIDKGGAP